MKWDIRFLKLAKHVAEWSKDPSTQVGAVIAKDKRVISMGFNGFPRGVDDSEVRLNTRGLKYDLIIHAEINALSFAYVDVGGATLYTYPMQPCVRCATQVIQSGIKRVVTIVPSTELNERWGGGFCQVKEIFEEAGVKIGYIPEHKLRG